MSRRRAAPGQTAVARARAGARVGLVLEARSLTLRMPEGSYRVRGTVTRERTSRGGWGRVPTIRLVVDGGVPFPNKRGGGGDDRVYSESSSGRGGRTLEEALADLRADVMRDRERLGGPGWRPRARSPAAVAAGARGPRRGKNT